MPCFCKRRSRSSTSELIRSPVSLRRFAPEPFFFSLGLRSLPQFRPLFLQLKIASEAIYCNGSLTPFHNVFNDICPAHNTAKSQAIFFGIPPCFFPHLCYTSSVCWIDLWFADVWVNREGTTMKKWFGFWR